MARETLATSLEKIFIGSVWWLYLTAIILFVPFLRIWWWILIPLMLSVELKHLYIWWIDWDYAYANVNWVVLELIPPKEVLSPLKAMEDVFSVIWGPLYNAGNWRERWFEGVLDNAPGWMSWELVSIEGTLHFYVRVQDSLRPSLETVLYSHYPELEIHQVDDYAKKVPQNLPNKEWNVYGEDFIYGGKYQVLPIKTYAKFFDPDNVPVEEKRIDPIGSILELMSKLGPGEQYWFQFTTMAVTDHDNPEFKEEAKKLITKISRRPEKRNKTFFEHVGQVISDLIFGPKKEGDTYKWLGLEPVVSEEGERELLITGGEKEVLVELENKIKKPIFRTHIRGVYVAKHENWNSNNKILGRAYFPHFSINTLNNIRFSRATRPKTQYFFRKRIPLMRTRKIFRNYVLRFPPFFPDRRRECLLMSTEELATLYHFPFKITGLILPTMARVESKRGGPPPNLPVE